MDEIVKKFLDEAKAREKEAAELADKKKKEERDAYLVSLGLVSGIERRWSEDYVHPYINWDNEKKMYYYDAQIAVEVTDEEFAEIQKYARYHKDKDSDSREEELSYNNGAERTLNTFNVIVLVLAIIAGVILFFASLYNEEYYLILGAIGIILVSVITWASVKVYINISNNLHAINDKLGKK